MTAKARYSRERFLPFASYPAIQLKFSFLTSFFLCSFYSILITNIKAIGFVQLQCNSKYF